MWVPSSNFVGIIFPIKHWNCADNQNDSAKRPESFWLSVSKQHNSNILLERWFQQHLGILQLAWAHKLTVFVVMLIGHPGCIGKCFRLGFEWFFVCHITVYNILFGHHERNINSTRVSLVIVTGLHQSFSLEPDQTPSWCLLMALFFI